MNAKTKKRRVDQAVQAQARQARAISRQIHGWAERPFREVHQPGHPDADENGMVKYPNVHIHEEMADLISASRAYEANMAVIRTSRTLAMQTINIGK